MTNEEAHRLLDAARDGAEISGARIARALRVTGDIGRPLQPVAPPQPGPFDWLLPSSLLQ